MTETHQQLDLHDQLDAAARTLAARLKKRGTIAERCEDFDAANPEVYAEIRRLALEAVRRGRRHLGIAQLVEVARWNLNTDARDAEGFKLNNSYRSVWARRLMAEEPELADVFETRTAPAAAPEGDTTEEAAPCEP